MKSDADVKSDVEDELTWDPDLDATDVVVTVKDGVVTLTGFVHSLNEKWQAESAAKRVSGVRGVANDLEVNLLGIGRRPDPEIVRNAVDALFYELPDHAGDIKVVVRDGCARLEGEVGSYQSRRQAERTVRRVRGVRALANTIKVTPAAATPEDVQRTVAEALRRNALLHGAGIDVEVIGHEVILRGTVRSWAERKEAEEAAWRAPGVINVDDRITISS